MEIGCLFLMELMSVESLLKHLHWLKYLTVSFVYEKIHVVITVLGAKGAYHEKKMSYRYDVDMPTKG